MATTMNLYKELPCAEYHTINQNLLEWIDSQHMDFKDFWNPIDVNDLIKSVLPLQKWLKQSDLLISSAAITYGTKTDCCGPHIDTPPARFKLSWPVKNTQGTWNRWFKVQDGVTESHINHWGGKIFHDISVLEEISRREVLMPALIDAGTIHDVWFDSSQPKWPRIVLQCKLFKEPISL